MPRSVYLAVYNSRLFPAHWAMWIPDPQQRHVGRRIHAEGDALNGFEVLFERNYDMNSVSQEHQLVLLGEVADEHVADEEPAQNGQGRKPSDALEEVALTVPAPSGSLVSSSASRPKRRVEIKNCQTWLRDFIQALIKRGVMDHAALDILDKAPKN